MRKFEHESRRYELSERDYKKLLDKLDTGKAYLDTDDCDRRTCRIDNSCICPKGAAWHCSICPLGPETINCLTLLTAAAGMRRQNVTGLDQRCHAGVRN